MTTDVVTKTKTLTFNDQEIVIKKVPLRRLITLLDDLSKFEEFQNIENLKNEEFLSKLPDMIATSFPKFADIIAKALNTGDDKINGDWLLDNVALDEAIDLIEAIMEVNNVSKIIEKIKKVQTLNVKKAGE